MDFVKKFISAIILIFICFGAYAQSMLQTGEQPKLVVGIMIENMRHDYIQRYWNKYGENGFRKLYSQGAICNNVQLKQHIQNYASGTATLFTGVYPATHGVINKNWYDKFNVKETECTEDNSFIAVGSDSKEGLAAQITFEHNHR